MGTDIHTIFMANIIAQEKLYGQRERAMLEQSGPLTDLVRGLIRLLR